MSATAAGFSTPTTQVLIRRLLWQRRRPGSRCGRLLLAIVALGAVIPLLAGSAQSWGQGSPSPVRMEDLVACLSFPQGFAIVTATRNPHRDPEELKILTGPTGGKIIFDRGECCGLLYMIPLNIEGTLLLTRWDGGAPTRVFHIKDRSARQVMDKSGWPELSVAQFP